MNRVRSDMLANRRRVKFYVVGEDRKECYRRVVALVFPHLLTFEGVD